MLQHALKTGLMVMVLGLLVQDVQAFGRHHGWGGCGPYGCAYGGYAGCGPWGCGYAGWGGGWGSGGWYGGYAGYDGLGTSGYLVRNAAPSATAPQAQANNRQSIGNSLKLTVNVPADAKVIVNGQQTTSTGEVRQYTSTGLQPGAVYRYQVRAEFTRDGKPVSEEQTVDFTAGQSRSIAFQIQPSATVADSAKTAKK